MRVRFEHDAAGALLAAIDADGNATRIERDDAGRAIATTSPLGRRHQLRCDEHGRIAERRDPAGGPARYAPQGHKQQIQDAAPKTLTAIT